MSGLKEWKLTVETCHLEGVEPDQQMFSSIGSSSESSVFQHTRGSSSKPNVFQEPEGPNMKGPEAKKESLEIELARGKQTVQEVVTLQPASGPKEKGGSDQFQASYGKQIFRSTEISEIWEKHRPSRDIFGQATKSEIDLLWGIYNCVLSVQKLSQSRQRLRSPGMVGQWNKAEVKRSTVQFCDADASSWIKRTADNRTVDACDVDASTWKCRTAENRTVDDCDRIKRCGITESSVESGVCVVTETDASRMKSGINESSVESGVCVVTETDESWRECRRKKLL
uniref:Uncharacterized protein n=1 Tax=Ditylenchus dipsaci TaxID=166011 RepID=A0A915EGB3_9BILA